MIECFNTSHVVIYHNNGHIQISFIQEFQYISCCYLSIHEEGMGDGTNCFNTSHVVIYLRIILFVLLRQTRFQYISCCYLSFWMCRVLTLLSMFQYISCCYLSRKLLLYLWWQRVSIHLMLLFITLASRHLPAYVKFQYISCCYLSC